MSTEKQSQQVETTLLEYPYKAFGLLKVTARQLIFKKVFPGFNTFSGVINISDLAEVRYLKGFPLLGVPGLEIVTDCQVIKQQKSGSIFQASEEG
jgi:hypothetical protein